MDNEEFGLTTEIGDGANWRLSLKPGARADSEAQSRQHWWTDRIFSLLMYGANVRKKGEELQTQVVLSK